MNRPRGVVRQFRISHASLGRVPITLDHQASALTTYREQIRLDRYSHLLKKVINVEYHALLCKLQNGNVRTQRFQHVTLEETEAYGR